MTNIFREHSSGTGAPIAVNSDGNDRAKVKCCVTCTRSIILWDSISNQGPHSGMPSGRPHTRQVLSERLHMRLGTCRYKSLHFKYNKLTFSLYLLYAQRWKISLHPCYEH
ncbi:hypothetical protein BV22DRAFT_423050 [Leucogyrophana mollusca]|uniref:Uncharacterized protein n=1 Tax=Leucogyrophana mollusca TaxID=85980 RepID=A0ACB8BIB7_9AGAM|nr:hypothetical protein BV22DRAFT_423050 [Leucogyrophana mollusca]